MIEKGEAIHTEKIPMLTIYKMDGKIFADFSRDTTDFELFGFLKCFIKEYEAMLTESLEDKEGER